MTYNSVPPEILSSPGNKAVTVAERVVLTCSVGGDPPPKVIWTKNGRPVQLSERIRQLDNGSLVIIDSTVRHFLNEAVSFYGFVSINKKGRLYFH